MNIGESNDILSHERKMVFDYQANYTKSQKEGFSLSYDNRGSKQKMDDPQSLIDECEMGEDQPRQTGTSGGQTHIPTHRETNEETTPRGNKIEKFNAVTVSNEDPDTVNKIDE